MSRGIAKDGAEKKHLGSGGVFREDMQFGRKETAEPAATSSQRIQLNAGSKAPQDMGKHPQHRPQQQNQGKEQDTAANPVSDVKQSVSDHSGIKAHIANEAASPKRKHKYGNQNTYSSDKATQPDIPNTPHNHSEPTGNAADAPSQGSGAKFQTDGNSKLNFRNAENAPEMTKFSHDKKVLKAERQLEKATNKLEKAKSRLPAKRKLKRLTYENAKTGEIKHKLHFEKEPVPQGKHLKGALPLRPVKAVTNAAIIHAHRKLYQVENENVGIKAAHRAEMTGEVGVRSALRHHKMAPYKYVAKLEKKAAKKSVKLTYQKVLAENPKLKGNIFARAMQKHRIKRQYAKAARDAQKAAKAAKKAGEQGAKAISRIMQAAAKHPVVAVLALIVLLILLFVMPFITVCSGAGNGIVTTIAASTFIAADDDMYAAEEAYAAMEKELQEMLDDYETLNPGYDEYIYILDDIEHDPYVLICILHALHDGVWTIGDVQGTLEMLFERQYILTETTKVELRYRTVTNTYIDPYTGLLYEVEEEEAYYYYIRTVKLENFNLSHLPVYIMGEKRLSRYALLKATLGNRPDLFPVGSYPNASTLKEYEKYDIPQAYLDADPRFAAMIAEANKYLGMPYVWGGSNPNTSFDCSGFVSWVMNQTGWDIGRLGARGLHSYSTPVSASQARPGDLVFFHNTYAAEYPDQATHVGIYVGDGMMVHAGDPIGYTSIETTYWQNHLLGFGRIY